MGYECKCRILKRTPKRLPCHKPRGFAIRISVGKLTTHPSGNQAGLRFTFSTPPHHMENPTYICAICCLMQIFNRRPSVRNVKKYEREVEAGFQLIRSPSSATLFAVALVVFCHSA